MSPDELKAAIEHTKKEIYLLKDQVEQTTDQYTINGHLISPNIS